MTSSVAPVIILRTLLVSLALLTSRVVSSAAQPASFPKCPFTNKYPIAPTVLHTRCPDASTYACCNDCSDINSAITKIGASASDLIWQIGLPGIPDNLPVPRGQTLQMCSLFTGKRLCSFLVESLICATTCNPDSGAYVSGVSNAPTLTICQGLADRIHDECAELEIMGIMLTGFFPRRNDFTRNVISSMVRMLGVPGLTINVTKDGSCFPGPTSLPPMPVCCDPITIPKACPSGSIMSSSSLGSILNRTIDPLTCNANSTVDSGSSDGRGYGSSNTTAPPLSPPILPGPAAADGLPAAAATEAAPGDSPGLGAGGERGSNKGASTSRSSLCKRVLLTLISVAVFLLALGL